MKHASHTTKSHSTGSNAEHNTHGAHGPGHYGRLALMMALSFAAMYGLMYAMVDTWGNVTSSLNQAYMAGLMTAPMLMLELALMGRMYPNKRLNLFLWIAAGLVLVGFWVLIRQQALIGDKQFLRSMIPHHAGAILMCNEASISDPKIVALCEKILASQSQEIASMQSWLRDADGK